MTRDESTNVFRDGLMMDLNPMIVPNTTLTDALNATIATNNGNEGLLLNDMGNALVHSTYLPEGYAPIGTCEYGGLIYILSYNPITKKSLIGSFPSPKQMDFDNLISEKINIINDNSFVNSDGKIRAKEVIVELTDKYLNAGDKYIIYNNVDDIIELDFIEKLSTKDVLPRVLVTPVSIEESGKITDLTNSKLYSIELDGKKTSEFFIYPTKINSIDTLKALNYGTANNYSIFSSKIPGKLGLKFKLIEISNFAVTWTPTYKIEKNPETGDLGIKQSEFGVLLETTWDGEGYLDKIVVNDDDKKLDDPIHNQLSLEKAFPKLEEGITYNTLKDHIFKNHLYVGSTPSIINPITPYYIADVKKEVTTGESLKIAPSTPQTYDGIKIINSTGEFLPGTYNALRSEFSDNAEPYITYRGSVVDGKQQWNKLSEFTNQEIVGIYNGDRYTISNCTILNSNYAVSSDKILTSEQTLVIYTNNTSNCIIIAKDASSILKVSLYSLSYTKNKGSDNLEIINSDLYYRVHFNDSEGLENLATNTIIANNTTVAEYDNEQYKVKEGVVVSGNNHQVNADGSLKFETINGSDISFFNIDAIDKYDKKYRIYIGQLISDNTYKLIEFSPEFITVNDWIFGDTSNVASKVEYTNGIVIEGIEGVTWENMYAANLGQVRYSQIKGAVPTKEEFESLFAKLTRISSGIYKGIDLATGKEVIFDFKVRDNDVYYWTSTQSAALYHCALRVGKNDWDIVSLSNKTTAHYLNVVRNIKTESIEDLSSDLKVTLLTGLTKFNDAYYLNHDLNYPYYLYLDRPQNLENEQNIKIQPWYPYGYDSTLEREIQIDWSKVGSGLYDLNIWKYYKTDDYIQLRVGFELYPLFNYEVDHIDLEFYDNLENYSFIYRLDGRNSYSGVFDINIPFLNSNLSEIIPNPNGHIGQAFDMELDGTYNVMVLKDNVFVPTVITKDGDLGDNVDNIELYYNDAGLLYPNICYLVKTKIYISSKNNSEPIVAKIIDRALWTNGIFNDQYYTNEVETFHGLSPKLRIAGTVNPTSFKEDKQTDTYFNNVNDPISRTTITPLSSGDEPVYHMISYYSGTLKLDIVNSFLNDYDSFKLSSNAKIKNTIGLGKTIIDEELNDLPENGSTELVSYLSLTSAIADLNGDSTTSKLLTYVSNDGIIEKTTLILDSDKKSVSLQVSISKLNPFKFLDTEKQLKSYTVFKPIIYDKDSAELNGLIIPNNYSESRNTYESRIPTFKNMVFWHKSDTDDRNKDLRMMIYAVPQTLASLTNRNFSNISADRGFYGGADFHGQSRYICHYSSDGGFYKKWEDETNEALANIFRSVEKARFCLLCPLHLKRPNADDISITGIADGWNLKGESYLREARTGIQTENPTPSSYYALGCVDKNGLIHLTNTIFKYGDYPSALLASLLSLTYISNGERIEKLSKPLLYNPSKDVEISPQIVVLSEFEGGISHSLLINNLYLESYVNAVFKHAENTKNLQTLNDSVSIENGSTYKVIMELIAKNTTLSTLYKSFIPEIEKMVNTVPIPFKYTTKVPEGFEASGNTIILYAGHSKYVQSTGNPSSIYFFDSSDNFVSVEENGNNINFTTYTAFTYEKVNGIEELIPDSTRKGKEITVSNFGDLFIPDNNSIVLSNKLSKEGKEFSYISRFDSHSNHGDENGGGWVACKVAELIFGEDYGYEHVDATK